jgi:hypothetical protein
MGCQQGVILFHESITKTFIGDQTLTWIGWDVGHGEESQHAIPVHLFPKHVMDLHMNGEVGFAKEYEEIRAASCLGRSKPAAMTAV